MSPYRQDELAKRAPRTTWARWLMAFVRGVFLRRWYHRHFIICQMNDYGGNFGPRFRWWRGRVEGWPRQAEAPDQRSLHGLPSYEAAPAPAPLPDGSIFKMHHDEATAAAEKPRALPPPIPLPGPGRPTLK